jgi:purine-binding chemotaxis protein CheW
MSTWNQTDRDRQAPGDFDLMQLVCFCVGAQEYALDIMRVKEIIHPAPVAVVPNAPHFIEGVIELRGTFLALIDLRKRFGLEPTPITHDSKYVVVLMDGQMVGMIVDRVLDVRRIARAELGAAPELAIGPRSRFIAGVAKRDDKVLMLIDLDQVLSRAEVQEMRAVAGEGGGE